MYISREQLSLIELPLSAYLAHL